MDADDLDATVDRLVATLVDKAALPLQATKAHIDAITAQMTGTAHTWADTDGLVAALGDDESRAAAHRYLDRLSDRG